MEELGFCALSPSSRVPPQNAAEGMKGHCQMRLRARCWSQALFARYPEEKEKEVSPTLSVHNRVKTAWMSRQRTLSSLILFFLMSSCRVSGVFALNPEFFFD